MGWIMVMSNHESRHNMAGANHECKTLCEGEQGLVSLGGEPNMEKRASNSNSSLTPKLGDIYIRNSMQNSFSLL